MPKSVENILVEKEGEREMEREERDKKTERDRKRETEREKGIIPILLNLT